jgi:hypothetical protein
MVSWESVSGINEDRRVEVLEECVRVREKMGHQIRIRAASSRRGTGSAYHHPWRFAQRSRVRLIASMSARSTAS